MSQLRHDPIQKRWVIIAEERQKRAGDFILAKSEKRDPKNCPFCPGNERNTPPEIAAYRNSGSDANTPGWKVRVVPNRYPALSVEPSELGRFGEGIYDGMNGIGAHEVIIEGPEHDEHMAEYEERKMVDVFRMYRDRLTDLMQDGRLRYVLIFKNCGEPAGATLSHPHSQIIATPITPRTVAMELDSAREHYRSKERCLFCDILRQEVQSGERVIYDDGAFVSLAPYASRFPFEVMIIPRKHLHSFSRMTEEDLLSLGQCMKDVMRRLRSALDDPPFNFVLHTAPNALAKPVRPGYWVTLEQDYHWHIEIIPRLVKMAGFEWGSGFYINPTPPEQAAKFLREMFLD